MSNFQKVAAMNVAFGNPAREDAAEIDFNRIRKQCLNITDELGELFIALGAHPASIKAAVENFKIVARRDPNFDVNLNGVRDALCDIHVFAYGAHHLMRIDADKDMDAVLNGVMTRFIKDRQDLHETKRIHAIKGVTDVYLEGTYPTMIMKSASDQPDAPKGKFLKSASYKDTVFPPI